MHNILVLHSGLSLKTLQERIPDDLRDVLTIWVEVTTQERARAEIGYYDPNYIVMADSTLAYKLLAGSDRGMGIVESTYLGRPRIFVFLTEDPETNADRFQILKELLDAEK